MAKRGKKYNEVAKLIDRTKKYSVAEAVALVKKTAIAKFDSTIDVSFKLHLDTKQPDQQLRGTIVLPNGNGKTKKILALTNTQQAQAKAAGADFVGAADMIEKIQKENWFGYDIIVATPDMMVQIGRLGRILGPKGLMPNPKTGTVTMNIGSAITEIKNGKVAYRTDKDGNIQLTFGKASFTEEKLAENLRTVINLVLSIRPSSVKGVYVQGCAISSTMGPSVSVDVNAL